MKRITIADIADTEAVKKAEEFGIDLTLTNENLQLTPTQRLQRVAGGMEFLDELARSRSKLRRSR